MNEITIKSLKKSGVQIDNVYPDNDLGYFPPLLKGIRNILFFFSLVERKKDIASYDIIQGTTYTPLAFLTGTIPVISTFGSTSYGFLKQVPSLKGLNKECPSLEKIFCELKEKGIISCLNPYTRPIQDISKIELHVAKNSAKVIAASEHVKQELLKNGIAANKITVIWNGIENFWFKQRPRLRIKKQAGLAYLGRIGEDAFTVKLKGINRLIFIIRSFPQLTKNLICLTEKTQQYAEIFKDIPKLNLHLNLKRRQIPKILKKIYGDILINTSRYEGFCLSLVEAMSQGLIPISFPVGVAPEIIKSGHNGYLVNNLRQMMAKINLLAYDNKKRISMAKNAMETAKMFKVGIMVQKYLDVYNSLINENKPTNSPAVI